MEEIKSINIIGCGRVGTVLGRLFVGHNLCRIQEVLNRSPQSSSEAVSLLGQGKSCGSIQSLKPADITLITSRDSQIEALCNELLFNKKLKKGSLLFHCSGALSSQIFHSAQKAGVLTASIHPIRSFSDPGMPLDGFQGTWCGLEGESKACDSLEKLFSQLGARIFRLDSGEKVLYHVASVLVSNYLTTLLDLGNQIYQKSGIPGEVATKFMEPLVRGTVDNFFKEGPVKSLTGPFSRGDIATIESHLKALKNLEPEFANLYKTLGLKTVDLAAKMEVHQTEVLNALREILNRD